MMCSLYNLTPYRDYVKYSSYINCNNQLSLMYLKATNNTTKPPYQSNAVSNKWLVFMTRSIMSHSGNAYMCNIFLPS